MSAKTTSTTMTIPKSRKAGKDEKASAPNPAATVRAEAA